MSNDNDRIIFHVDVNSAYLSWSAVKLLQYGETMDIRTIPSVIAGDIENRRGIILAASIPAKNYGIKTGEPIFSAKQKFKDLKVFPPDYDWYVKSSNAMVRLLEEYSPIIQRYSIDECFLDCSHYKNDYKRIAMKIKMRIADELGFNVNIGISSNKLLAKMASDFKPKNSVHTLFKEEIKEKMWPLPVEDLFMVGRATSNRLRKFNINTIGELANMDETILINMMHSHGKLIHEFANGIENSDVRKSNYLEIKGIGNSTTIAYDIENKEEAFKVLLSLAESCSMRLRENDSLCSLVAISIKTNDFMYYSHQKSLLNPTNSTNVIYEYVKKTFLEIWKGEKIRQLGIRLGKLSKADYCQESLFDFQKNEKQMKLDKAIDEIRKRFGQESVIRSTFLHSGIKPLEGGTGSKCDYPMMGSLL